MKSRLLVVGSLVLAASLLGGLAAALLVPVPVVMREEVHEIPKGTWARRMTGDAAASFPERIRLTLGVNDVLVLRNLDDVPHQFGPALMMPGQSFRLPFSIPSEFQFACTAHASGQMVIVVDPHPDTPWARLRWRSHRTSEWLKG